MGKILTMLVVLFAWNCSKAPLELNPQQEIEAVAKAYGFNPNNFQRELSVITCIDSTIQKQSEELLKMKLQEYNADNGCVIVMETAGNLLGAYISRPQAPKNTNFYIIKY